MNLPTPVKTLLRSAAALCISAAILFPVTAARAAFLPAAEPGDIGIELIYRESTPETADTGLALSLEEVKARQESDESIPHVWPVRFSEVGYVSSGFGNRIDPVTGESIQFHGGIDLADKPNTKIHASASGIVVEAEDYGGYGLTILVDHGNGYQSRYSHCSQLLVQVGDEVSQGQVIATMGSTGRATGVHLDFRIYLDDTLIDPLTVLDADGGR